LQDLGAAQTGKAGADDCDGTKFFHRDNVNVCTQGAITIGKYRSEFRFAVDFWRSRSRMED
jgi:hypothetical protein